MPTGYTAEIGEKDISLRDYAMGCARAFGPLIEMRDEPSDAPIPFKIEPSSYHKDNFKIETRKFYNAIGMRNDEAERLANQDYIEELESRGKSLEKSEGLAVKYGNMLAKVAKWPSPSPNHDEFRNFMISQLEQSLRFDCNFSLDPLQKMTGPEYRAKLVNDTKLKMEYHKKEHLKEVKDAKGKTGWINVLKECLPLD